MISLREAGIRMFRYKNNVEPGKVDRMKQANRKPSNATNRGVLSYARVLAIDVPLFILRFRLFKD